MAKHPIFRDEALEARHAPPIGRVLLGQPLSFTMLTIMAGSIGVILVLLLGFAEYTKKISVGGQLIPDKGIATVYARQAGVVTKRLVKEGQWVKKGDILLEISSELHGAGGDVYADVSGYVESRRHSLRQERETVKALYERARKLLNRKSESLKMQLVQLKQQLAMQRAQLELAEHDMARYRELVTKNYIAKDALVQKEAAVYEHESKVQTILREQTMLNTDFDSIDGELESLSLKHDQDIGALDRQLASESLAYVQNEAAQLLMAMSPQTGRVSSMNVEQGQHVETNRPLIAIIPDNSVLQAQLLVPSRAIGFVRPGTKVYLRYRTYPYQVFGLSKGTVASVSQSTLPAKDVNVGMGSDMLDDSVEPLFRVTVAIPEQQLSVKNVLYPLRPGMLLDADILIERKRIYEWIIDPLYGAAKLF